jgi:hypothetical protein
MRKNQFLILLFVVIVGVLIFTNPDEQEHKDAVKNKLVTAYNKKMSSKLIDSENGLENIGAGFGLMIGENLIDKLVDGFVARDNYVLFSLTTATYKGQTKTIGFGIIGNIFLTSKIDEAFNSNEPTISDVESDDGEESGIAEVKNYNLHGILKREQFYGPPGYGEDPQHDKKEQAYILYVDKSFSLNKFDGFKKEQEYGRSFGNITKAQLVTNESLKNLIGTSITVEGDLFESHTGHHHTDVLMSVTKLFEY